MNKNYILFLVLSTVIVGFNCFGGIFSADVKKIVEDQQKAFAASSVNIVQCSAIKTAINAFTVRIQQDPKMMKLAKSTSIRWDWHEKFFGPIVKNFAQIHAHGSIKTDAFIAAIAAVITDAKIVRDLFVTSALASGEAKDAAETWFNKMIEITGLEIKKPKKVGFIGSSFGGSDKDDEKEFDFDDAEKAVEELAKKLGRIRKKIKQIKLQKINQESVMSAIKEKIQELETFGKIIASLIQNEKIANGALIEKMKKIHASLKLDLGECEKKLEEFLMSKAADDEDEEDGEEEGAV